MLIDRNTKLKDLLNAYPWLVDETIKMDERFKALKSPLGRMLIARATIADASQKTGIDEQRIIDTITEFIAVHEGQS